MLEGNFWAIKNVRLAFIAPLVVATATVSFASRAEAAGTVAAQALLFEEFLSREDKAGQLDALKARLQPVGKPVLVHGHCHLYRFRRQRADRHLQHVQYSRRRTARRDCHVR